MPGSSSERETTTHLVNSFVCLFLYYLDSHFWFDYIPTTAVIANQKLVDSSSESETARMLDVFR